MRASPADRLPRAAWWTLGALVFALLLLVAGRIPLFHTPDALVHVARADMLAHGQVLLAPAPPGEPVQMGGSGGPVDQSLYTLAFRVFEHLQTGKVDLARFRAIDVEAAALGWSGTTRYFPAAGTGYYFPALYLPHAAALWTARHLGLSMAGSYTLLVATTLAVCLALLVAAWRLRPPSLLVVAIVATPMAVFQILSPTLDGITICLAVYAMHVYLGVLNAPPDAGDWKKALLFALGAFLLISLRANLLPLLALPFLLAWRKPSRALWAIAIGLTLATLGWTLFALAATIDTRLVRAHGSTELIAIYLRDPLLFVQLLGRTLGDPQMLTLYVHSFFGMLGWLDAPIARPLLLTLMGLLAALGATTVLQTRQAGANPYRVPATRTLDQAVVLFVAAASSVLVFFALAVMWNDHPAAQVLGVQGRYFFVPAIVAASLWAPPPLRTQPRATAALQVGLLVAYIGVSAYALVSTLNAHYH